MPRVKSRPLSLLRSKVPNMTKVNALLLFYHMIDCVDIIVFLKKCKSESNEGSIWQSKYWLAGIYFVLTTICCFWPNTEIHRFLIHLAFLSLPAPSLLVLLSLPSVYVFFNVNYVFCRFMSVKTLEKLTSSLKVLNIATHMLLDVSKLWNI